MDVVRKCMYNEDGVRRDGDGRGWLRDCNQGGGSGEELHVVLEEMTS